MAEHRIWFDCDTGVDDAIALLTAHRQPGLEIVGLSTVAGNVTLRHTTENTLKICGLMGADYPVYPGAPGPLRREREDASSFHGADGRGGAVLPAPRRAPEQTPAWEDIEAKKQIILRHGLALWDTLERCTITGAADASIKDAVPNDIAALLAKAPIEAVFCNGATAFRIYTKYLQPVSGIAAVKLPSTSPANAACRPEKLREIWGAALLPWINK